MIPAVTAAQEVAYRMQTVRGMRISSDSGPNVSTKPPPPPPPPPVNNSYGPPPTTGYSSASTYVAPTVKPLNYGPSYGAPPVATPPPAQKPPAVVQQNGWNPGNFFSSVSTAANNFFTKTVPTFVQNNIAKPVQTFFTHTVPTAAHNVFSSTPWKAFTSTMKTAGSWLGGASKYLKTTIPSINNWASNAGKTPFVGRALQWGGNTFGKFVGGVAQVLGKTGAVLGIVGKTGSILTAADKAIAAFQQNKAWYSKLDPLSSISKNGLGLFKDVNTLMGKQWVKSVDKFASKAIGREIPLVDLGIVASDFVHQVSVDSDPHSVYSQKLWSRATTALDALAIPYPIVAGPLASTTSWLETNTPKFDWHPPGWVSGTMDVLNPATALVSPDRNVLHAFFGWGQAG